MWSLINTAVSHFRSPIDSQTTPSRQELRFTQPINIHNETELTLKDLEEIIAMNMAALNRRMDSMCTAIGSIDLRLGRLEVSTMRLLELAEPNESEASVEDQFVTLNESRLAASCEGCVLARSLVNEIEN